MVECSFCVSRLKTSFGLGTCLVSDKLSWSQFYRPGPVEGPDFDHLFIWRKGCVRGPAISSEAGQAAMLRSLPCITWSHLARNIC